ncbi:hypothetical protein O6H91_20G076600 [Diphasiastrum complanatum]|uniref:Uncharacterized protein n=1 Tax=Diphasiastrum complanatum TaxID=34168 RepID=A0ACC2ARY1_DIPCM|nr:hypothetical protein O6H91_20G076600 [Diphasiastrum complanatum]
MEGQDCESTFTLEDAIDSIGFGQFQMLILLYAGISWMAEAMEMMLLSFVGPAVQSLWNLTPKEQSFISSVVFGGMMIGAYSWGILSDLKGRRVGFFVTAVVTFIAGFLSALSPDYYSLLFCRAIVGVGLGGGHVVSSWFLEFVPSPHRGQWMVVFSLFWTVGSVLEASLAWVVMPKLGWRWLLGFSSLPLIILLAFYPLVPESPWYFTAKGETSKALEILQKMAMVNKKELPAGRLISQTSVLKKDKVVEAAGVEMVQLLPLGPPIVTADVESRFSIVEQITSSLLVLVSPPLVSSTLLLWFVFFTNAFTYYGLVLLTSQLSSGYTDCAAEIGPKSLLRKDYNNLYRDVFITSLAGIIICWQV